MDIIRELIEGFDPQNPHFRPTEIFNEGWLLKAYLHQLADIRHEDTSLAFQSGSTWFSEALLPTAFKARYRGDPLAEARTNADAVIGHVSIGREGKADLDLMPDARQFVVIEAKIASPLSAGTVKAPYFDQAARNVACMAEVLRRAGRLPAEVSSLAFVVMAPQTALDADAFADQMDPKSIKDKVARRVAAYGGERDDWYAQWFEPTIYELRLRTLSWESALAEIQATAPKAGLALQEFYAKCLQFN